MKVDLSSIIKCLEVYYKFKLFQDYTVKKQNQKAKQTKLNRRNSHDCTEISLVLYVKTNVWHGRTFQQSW